MNRVRGLFWLTICFFLAACSQPSANESVISEQVITPAAAPPITLTQPALSQVTPTPTPPQPTPTPRPILPAQATATPNPALPDWTVLLYLPADYLYAPDPLTLLTTLSTALPGGRVQILAQLDRHPSHAADGFADARRYRLTPGSPELLTSLGEINMVDEAELTAFLTWGLQTAPANRYALIMAAPGGGWAGIGLDDTAPGDRLTLPELENALAQTRQTTGLDQFDLLLFTGSFLAQVDLFQAVQPHTSYVVASAGLASLIDLGRWLTLLATTPAPDAATLAQATIAQLDVSQSPGTSWVAVEMAQVPALTHAVEILAHALRHDPAYHAPVASAARRNAEAYTWLASPTADPIAALDAWHFASLISQLTDEAPLFAAATNLMGAVRQAIVAGQHSPDFLWARGIALPFPANDTVFNPDYVTQTRIPAWADWLHSYHQVTQKTALPPSISLGEPAANSWVNRQTPLFLGVELAGIDLEKGEILSGRYDRTGRRQLLEITPYVPRPQTLNDGSPFYTWTDGVHKTVLLWPAELPYLADSVRGDWVLAWPIGFTPIRAITGQVLTAGQETGAAAQLLWDQTQGRLISHWGINSGIPYPITPQANQLFRPDHWYLEFQGQLTSQPGRDLNLAELTIQPAPLTDGDYFVGFAAANSTGEHSQVITDVAVASSRLYDGYHIYIDPGFGFQFLYPVNWQRPTLDGQICQSEALTLCTFSPDQQIALRVIFYPEVGPRNGPMLRDEALAAFSGVNVLYQVEQSVAGQAAPYTVYGYTAPDGEHVGVLLTFVYDGMGYVVDLDGPAAEQVRILDAADKLLRSWQFQPLLREPFVQSWQELAVPGFTLNYPTEFRYSLQTSGWHQLDGGRHIFMALRLDAAAAQSPESILRTWLAATANKEAFRAVAPYPLRLGAYHWQRADFSWVAEDGSPVNGFIMVTVVDGRALIAWAETPTLYYLHLERSIFRIILADLQFTRFD